jgi:hypothetical protein
LLEFSKSDNFVEFAGDFPLAHAENGAAEIGVLASGELGMKASADFEKAADAAANFRPAGSGTSDAGKDFEESGFSGTVAADQSKDFTLGNFEGNVFEGPETFFAIGAEKPVGSAKGEGEGVSKPAGGGEHAALVALAEIFGGDDGGSHRSRVIRDPRC